MFVKKKPIKSKEKKKITSLSRFMSVYLSSLEVNKAKRV